MTTPFKVLTTPQTPRDQWLALRRDCVGASDTLLTPKLARQKAGLVAQFQGNAATARGQRLEPRVLEIVKSCGLSARGCQYMLQSTLWPEMSATLDGWAKNPQRPQRIAEWSDYLRYAQGFNHAAVAEAMAYDGLCVLELKTGNPRQLNKWQLGVVPENYWIQCQHQMAVTGLDVAWLAALVGDVDTLDGTEPISVMLDRADFFVRRIQRDQTFILDRARHCREFMKDVRYLQSRAA